MAATEKNLNSLQEDQLIELSNDKGLESLCKSSITLPAFWIHAFREFPELSAIALKLLMPFSSTYLCEAGFSVLVSIKTKCRSRLNIKSLLRLALSDIEPCLEKLVSAKQAQKSH